MPNVCQKCAPNAHSKRSVHLFSATSIPNRTHKLVRESVLALFFAAVVSHGVAAFVGRFADGVPVDAFNSHIDGAVAVVMFKFMS